MKQKPWSRKTGQQIILPLGQGWKPIPVGGKEWKIILSKHAGGSAAKKTSAKQETWVPPLIGEDPLEDEMSAYPVSLPGESHGQRSLVGYSPLGPNTCTRLSD